MDNQNPATPNTPPPAQPAAPASAPVTPGGTAYTPPPTTPDLQSKSPSPPQSSIPLTPPPPPASHKRLLLIVCVLLLLLLGGGGYLFMNMQTPQPIPQEKQVMTKPTPIATATPIASPAALPGWKTYTNTQYGFSLAYPPDELSRVTESILPITETYPNPITNINIQGANMIMDIAVATPPARLTIKNALGEGPGAQYKYSMINNQNKNFTNFTIDGIDAIRVDAVNVPPVPALTDVILFKDNRIYELTFYPVNSHNTEVFDKILSTFKFTK